MKNLDIFGGETETYTPPKGPYQKLKADMQYRLGTKEECCRRCKYMFRKGHHDKGYTKCQWIGDSASSSSDIVQRNVCKKFELKEDK